MDLINRKTQGNHRKMERRAILLVILYITQVSCQTESQKTKIDIDSTQCHSCSTSNKHTENLLDSVVDILNTFRENDYVNKTIDRLENEVERLLDRALSKDRYKIFDGIEIKPDGDKKLDKRSLIDDPNEERALFSKFTYEYRMLQKVKNFVNTHIVSINLPKAAQMIDFRSFGLNKFLLPLFIGGQVLFKSILLAMFLPSILGSFGKILGKGISQLSASSSQASYPPINGEDPTSYNNENKDVMGYESNQAGTYVFPDAYGTMDPNEVNEVGNVDMSRFGIPGQQMPSKNSYYQNQITANNYKVFQKIPASSMILSNYDPFYSPLLSRLDGIFARLGLAPSENDINDGMQIGGQSLTDVKLEACREQLICLMYATPAKYAPYSNLVSAQLSRCPQCGAMKLFFRSPCFYCGSQNSYHTWTYEVVKSYCMETGNVLKLKELNELRRPVSDNPEILRFFRYMRAARRGQEGVDCMRSFPACLTNTAPSHTMIAAYHDINKLVTARKLRNH